MNQYSYLCSNFSFTLHYYYIFSHNVSDVRLLLWTRKSPHKYVQLQSWNVVLLSTSNYNPYKDTKILIHGFADQGLTGWVKMFKKHYLEQEEYNIISVHIL